MRDTSRDSVKRHHNSNVSPAKLSLLETAIKYRVDDLPGALIPFSRLSDILKHLEMGRPMSSSAQEFLRSKELLALLNYAKKEFSFAEFLKEAEREQSERRLAVRPRLLKNTTNRS